MILNIFYQSMLSFFACLFFSITFNTPKKELFYCGFTGALGSFIYYIFIYFFKSSYMTSAFISSVCITICCRILSNVRQAPSTIYIIPGIIPLVPGANMYYTVIGIIKNDMLYSYSQAILAVKLAGAIAFGIIVVLSLPYSFFDIRKYLINKRHTK